MKLSEYVKNLSDLMKDKPETADMVVVSAIDEEGNGFNTIGFGPTVGQYLDGEFHDKDYDPENEDYVENAVCIN